MEKNAEESESKSPAEEQEKMDTADTSQKKEVGGDDFGGGGFKMPSLPGAPQVNKRRSSDPKDSKPDTLKDSKPDSTQNETKTESKPSPDNTEKASSEQKSEIESSPSSKTTGEDAKQENSKQKPPSKSPAELAQAKSIPLAYQEPSWGGVPTRPYSLEVIKNGTIIENIELKDKSFYTIGRLANCDINMEHPSLSRYHAVLQFKSKGSPEKPVGFYLYDLDSTHGSFHNKNKCFPKTFYRLRVGHMLKFGMSTRTLILQGPDEDVEEESELSVTELKALAAEKARKKEEERAAALKKMEEGEDGEENGKGEEKESTGIHWGMADDAEEFPDMDQNPFAETADNEKLYINDPKKALKNWFDREGYDLEYEVEEKGYAQFLCKVHLPVDAPPGVNTVAEASVKGKKKEATVQAALEACRILDRLNLLNPSQQSAVEKKVKRWEEDDFYASDEDEFLDRTGTIEKKRKQRMKMAGKAVEDKAETYDSLMEKYNAHKEELDQCTQQLASALARKEKADKDSEKLDLDSYLAELKHGAQVDKQTIQKLKVKISGLQQDLEKLTKLINIAKPASLPELVKPANSKPKFSGIMIGKRGSKGLLGKVKSVNSENKTPVVMQSAGTKVLDAFLEADQQDQEDKQNRRLQKCDEDDEEGDAIQPIGYEARPEPKPKERIGDTSFNTLNKLLGARGPQIPDHMRAVIEKKLKDVDMDSIDSESIKLPEQNEPESKQEVDTSPHDMDVEQPGDHTEDPTTGAVKRKRGDRGNKRRKKEVEGKQEDQEEEVEEQQESYYKVGADSKYDVWVPPAGQTGDGRTSLNDKLGY